MEEELRELLKKYVSIFINEYGNYLNKDQLDILRRMDYQKVIEFQNMDIPFGKSEFGKIYLTNNDELINNLKNMPNYNSNKGILHNKNLSSYLKYMCDNGYNLLEYYKDILMYFVFYLVIRNNSGFINGLIDQEIKFLSIKYSLKCASLYAREDVIIAKITPILKIEGCRKILFMDKVSAFKYLNDNYGFRYAKLVDDVSNLIDKEYQKIKEKEYIGFNGFINYVTDYDHLSYGDVYNHLLDFEVQNSL